MAMNLEIIKEVVNVIRNTDIRKSAYFNVHMIAFKQLVIPFGGEYASQIVSKMNIRVSQLAWDTYPDDIEQYITMICKKVATDYRIMGTELGRDGSRTKDFMLSQAHVYSIVIGD